MKDSSSFLYRLFPKYVPYSRRNNKYTKEIRAFVNSNDTTLKFPPSLTTLERRWVHQITSQWKCLESESFGEGESRYVVVSKKSSPGLTQSNFIFYFLTFVIK